MTAVARTRSFGRAAAELGYTQSAISSQIATLERAVGSELVRRTRGSRSVDLTSSGEVLLAHAEVVAAEIAAARARLATPVVETNVRIGVFPTLGSTLPTRLLSVLRSELRTAAVAVRELVDDAHLLRELAAGELDVAFTSRTPSAAARLRIRSLLDDSYVFVAPGGARIGDAAVAVEAIARFPLVGPARGDSARALDDLFRAASVEPNWIVRSDDVAVLNESARRCVGAAIMPMLLVADDLQPHATPLDDLVEPRSIAVAWPSGLHLSRAVSSVVSAAVRVASELRERTAQRLHAA